MGGALLQTLTGWWLGLLGFAGIVSLTTYSLVTSTDVLPNVSISSILTTLVAVVTSVAILFQIRADSVRVLWFFSPWLALVLVQGVSLSFHPSLPGTQNFLGLIAFTGVLVFSATYRNLNPLFLERFIAISASLSFLVSVFVVIFYLGFEGVIPDERSFAMTYVLGLALALAWRPLRGIYTVVPWTIWLAIAVTGSRTATAVAALLVLLAYLRGVRSRPLQALARGAISSSVIAGLYAVILRAQDRLQEVWKPGDSAIQLPTPPGPTEATTVVINSNGRIDVWVSLIGQLQGYADWIFGKGTGFSAQFSRENFSSFVQSLNEYVRFLVDNGLIGLGLFLTGLALLIFRPAAFFSTPEHQRLVTYVAIAFALIGITEPVAIYVFYSLASALIMGLALNHSFSGARHIAEGVAPTEATSCGGSS